MNKQQKHSGEYEAAKNEKPFTAESLTEEILPLLGDYFVAEFKKDGNVIIAEFPNGQTFKIKTELQ